MPNGTTYEEEWKEDVLVDTKLLMDGTVNKQAHDEVKKDIVTFEKILGKGYARE